MLAANNITLDAATEREVRIFSMHGRIEARLRLALQAIVLFA